MVFLLPLIYPFLPYLISPITSLPLDQPKQEVPSAPPANLEDESIMFLFLILILSFIFIGGFLLGLILIIKVVIEKLTFNSVKLNNVIPGSLDDEFEIEERIRDLSPNEQNLYRSGQDYIKQNPPYLQELTLSEHMLIQEKGIEAWEFIPDLNLNPDAIFVVNKTELSFTSFDYQCSIQTNLPIPKINDVYYYEMKVFNLDSPEDTIISAGLSTRPYPYFRLPGRHLYSIAYDSTGSRRWSNSFKISEAESSVFPKLIQGDVIGIGYRVRSGTIFFTRNGKKLSEKSIGGHIKGVKLANLYPTIGANNPCSVHINVGQYGYVFIEANIKKWGYAAKEGNMPPLPDYNYSSNDLLLESSNEDDESISPPDFFRDVGYESSSSYNNSIAENLTLNTIQNMPTEPPLYISDEDQYEDDDRLLNENTLRNQFAESGANTTESTTLRPEVENDIAEVELEDNDDKSMDLNDETFDSSHNITQSTSDTNAAIYVNFAKKKSVANEEESSLNLSPTPDEESYEASVLNPLGVELAADESRDDTPA